MGEGMRGRKMLHCQLRQRGFEPSEKERLKGSCHRVYLGQAKALSVWEIRPVSPDKQPVSGNFKSLRSSLV